MSIELPSRPSALPLADARAAGPAVRVSLVAAQPEWDALVAGLPHPHLPQSFAYGAAKAAKGWAVDRVRFVVAGETVAIATVLQQRRLGLRLLSRINRAPLFLAVDPAPELVVGVYAALRRRFRGPLMIAPALPHGPESARLLRTAGYHQRMPQGWHSGLIDLEPAEDEIWAGFSSPFRNRVRKAERDGAELRVANDDATYEWMLARHEENMRDKGFRALDAQFLRALRDGAPDDVLVFQALVDRAPVAGMSVVRTAGFAEYHIGWFGAEGRRINAGNFLMWNIIRQMRRRGAIRFDLGGMRDGDGYTRFKRTMIPNEYELAGEWITI